MDTADQRAETDEVFARLSRRYVLPDSAPLGLQFVPSDGPSDRDTFVNAAEALGYEAIWFPGEDEEDDAAGYLELERVISPVTADEIWRHESLLTDLARVHGFIADGWGFLAPLEEVGEA